MITNFGKHEIALLLGGSTSNEPSYFKIGTGSATVTVTRTDLTTATDRQLITEAINPTRRTVLFQADWSSYEISGTQLSEYGLTGSATGVAGSVWSLTVIPSLTFDGGNELRVEESWSIY